MPKLLNFHCLYIMKKDMNMFTHKNKDKLYISNTTSKQSFVVLFE